MEGKKEPEPEPKKRATTRQQELNCEIERQQLVINKENIFATKGRGGDVACIVSSLNRKCSCVLSSSYPDVTRAIKLVLSVIGSGISWHNVTI